MDGNLGVGIAKPSLSVFVSLGVSGKGDMLNVLASESCLVSSVGVNAPERSFCQSLKVFLNHRLIYVVWDQGKAYINRMKTYIRIIFVWICYVKFRRF